MRGIKKLRGHGDDAVYEVSVDDVLSDFSLAAGLGGKGTVRQHHADASIGGQMPDHMLKPREVGVACGWYTMNFRDLQGLAAS